MELIGAIARKQGEPSQLALEAAKTARAAVIGRDTGLFRVPDVVAFDRDRGVLDTERVAGFASLAELAARHDPRVPELCVRAGRALAAVHQHLRLPDEYVSTMPSALLTDRPDAYVFVHGDYNGANVGYDASRDQLVIVDWSTAPALSGRYTRAPRYLDIIWFGVFFYRFQRMGELSWRPGSWLQQTIQGYQSILGQDFIASDYERFRQEFDPFLLADYKEQYRRSAQGVKRLPHWVRLKIVWQLWRNAAHGARA